VRSLLLLVPILACSQKRDEPPPPPEVTRPAEVAPTTPVEATAPQPAEPGAAEPQPAEPQPGSTIGPPLDGPAPVPRMLFRRNHQSWIANLDGSGARQLDRTFHSSISSDGRFALLLDGSTEPIARTLVDLENGTRTPVTGALIEGPPQRFVADADWLVFGKERVRRDGSARQESRCPPGHDGSYLLCVSAVGFHEAALDGTQGEAVSVAELAGVPPSRFAPTDLSVSHDGRLVAIGATLLDERLGNGLQAIWVYDRVDRRATRVTTETQYARFPQFVRDGSIVFDGFELTPASIRGFNDDESVTWSIYAVTPDGSGLRELVRNASEPSVAGP
jgi:hypothetical protein